MKKVRRKARWGLLIIVIILYFILSCNEQLPSLDLMKQVSEDTGKINSNLAGLEWVEVKGGVFDYGMMYNGIDSKYNTKVTLSSFEINKQEITINQYRKCVEAGFCKNHEAAYQDNSENKYYEATKDYSVVNVSWTDAQNYCSWVGGRLPSKSEWEYAATNEGKTRFPWGNETATCKVSNLNCSDKVVQPTKLNRMKGCNFPQGATKSGICDFIGNVSEWVYDWSSNGYVPADGSPNMDEPINIKGCNRIRGEPKDSRKKVTRGGNFYLKNKLNYYADDFDVYHYTESSFIGFRCIRRLSEHNHDNP